jgi:DNA polymerase-3 subunit alpha/error-prone DNA polymerase
LRTRDLRKLAGERVELVVRIVDARGKQTGGGLKYFYPFEDETGVLEGVGSGPCLSVGEPPVCWVRGEVRMDGTGLPKVFDCAFSCSF